MAMSFRNVDADPSSPVEEWPYEAIVIAIERGGVTDWARLVRAVGRDPWGPVARQVEEYLSYERPYGVAPLLDRAITRARSGSEQRDRDAVAAEVRALVAASGLSADEFASRIGTSRTRLSTYRNGRVVPSAALLLRMRRVSENRPHE